MDNPPIKIDPEFQKLIPPLAQEELMLLENSILHDGCRDPLVVWQGHNILLDGHNRYRICNRSKTPFATVELAMADREAAKAWIITNQLGRRNLPPYVRVELAMLLEPLLTAQAKERRATGMLSRVGSRPKGVRELATAPIRVRGQIAKASGASDNTVFQSMVIMKEADEPTKAKLRTGELSINAVYKQLRPDSTTNRPRCTIALDEVDDALKQLMSRGSLEFLTELSEKLAIEVSRKQTAAKRGLGMFGKRS